MRYSGLYNIDINCLAFSVSMPTTTLSGLMKSSIALPSRKNSGFETTSKRASGFIFFIIFFTSAPVPTGTVDLFTITVYPSKFLAIFSAAS